MSALINRDPDGNPVTPAKVQSLLAKSVSPNNSERSSVRLFVGLAIAIAADALDVAFPMISLPVDFVTAILISLVFGWRWETVLVLVPEVIPGTAMFPTWVILVFYLAGIKARKL